MAWRSAARRGGARIKARPDKARHGKAGQGVDRGRARPGQARRGRARIKAWQGQARLGFAGLGEAGIKVWRGRAWPGLAGLGEDQGKEGERFKMRIYVHTVWMNDDAPENQLFRAHEHDAGLDIVAAESVTVDPGVMKNIKTGLRIALPLGTVGIIKGRSGLANTIQIEASNAGVIDQGYRGEIGVILRNFGDTPFVVQKGDRIAQLLVLPIVYCEAIRTETLPISEDGRHENGFGSSGR